MNAALPRLRRTAVAVAALTGALMLSACSSGYVDSGTYVSPIAATPAPMPEMPAVAVSGGAARPGRMPLLPPVPEADATRGLPPVSMASLLPPTR